MPGEASWERSCRGLRILDQGGVPGQPEEDVVQRRSSQRDVVDTDPGLVKIAHDLDQPGGAALRGDRQAAGVLVDDGCLAADPGQELDRTRYRVAPVDDDLDPFATDL